MSMRRIQTIIFTFAFWSITVHAHADIFVSIPGIQGESTASNRQGWMNILSGSWGHAQGANETRARGAQFSPLKLTKRIDGTSATLALLAADTKSLSEVLLEYTQPISSNQSMVLVRVRLINARIISYEAQIAEFPSEPTEEIHFTFGQILWTTFKRNQAGQVVFGSAGCYDVANQRPFQCPS